MVVAADDLRPSAAAVRDVDVEDTLFSEFELFVRGGRILLRNELPLPPSLSESSGGRASVPRAQKAGREVVELHGLGRMAVVGLDWRMLLLSRADGVRLLFSQGRRLKVLDPSPVAKDTGWTEDRRRILMEQLALVGKRKAVQQWWWAWRPPAAVVRAATAPNRRRFILLLLEKVFRKMKKFVRLSSVPLPSFLRTRKLSFICMLCQMCAAGASRSRHRRIIKSCRGRAKVEMHI